MFALRAAPARLISRFISSSSAVQSSRTSVVRQFNKTLLARSLHQSPALLQRDSEYSFYADQQSDSQDALSEVRNPRLNFSNLAPSKTLYVGNLFFAVTAEMLETELAPFGTIVSCRIATDNKGYSKGFGFVEFQDVESAAKAVEAKNQVIFEGRRLTIGFSKPRDSSQPPVRSREELDRLDAHPPTRSLYVGNMSFQMSDKDLNDLFGRFNDAVDVRVAIDRRSGQPRGFAHLDFIDVESATKARKELNGKEILGRPIRCTFCDTRPGTNRRSTAAADYQSMAVEAPESATS